MLFPNFLLIFEKNVKGLVHDFFLIFWLIHEKNVKGLG